MDSYVSMIYVQATAFEILLVLFLQNSSKFQKFMKVFIFFAVLQGLFLTMLFPEKQKKITMSRMSFLPNGSSFALEEAFKPKALLPGTAVIKVKSVALNPADYKFFNLFQILPFIRWVAPFGIGRDVSGEIVQINSCDEEEKIGDRVFGFTIFGR